MHGTLSSDECLEPFEPTGLFSTALRLLAEKDLTMVGDVLTVGTFTRWTIDIMISLPSILTTPMMLLLSSLEAFMTFQK